MASFRKTVLPPGATLAATAMVFGLGASRVLAAPHADITGVWMVQRPYQLGAPLSPTPKLTPYAQGIFDRREAAMKKGYVRSVSNMLCQGNGGPGLSQMRSPFEIFSGFGRMTMVFETETFNQPRTFYLNEKTQPDDLFPSLNGHSIAHWDGDALVVDTLGFDGRGEEPGRVPRSDKAHLVERFTLSPDRQILTDHVTVEDPVMLSSPWVFSLKYDRKPPTEERMEVVCDVDLEALKRTDLQSLKDADPEVARLLDPDQNGSDPALRIAAPKP